jgi:hypothetical protein
LARLFKKSYLKNEKELGHSENGWWRLVVAIYTPGSSIIFSLAILNGKSSLVLMSGPKRNPPCPGGAVSTTQEAPGYSALEWALGKLPAVWPVSVLHDDV